MPRGIKKTETAGEAEYWTDAQGRRVPVAHIDPVERWAERKVRALLKRGQAIEQQLAQYKADVLAAASEYRDRQAREYVGRQIADSGTGCTLKSFDGHVKIEVQIKNHVEFDDRINLAKSVLDEFLRDKLSGADPAIAALVEDAFRVDKKGRIDRTRLTTLRRVKIDDPKWHEAMNLIADSQRPVSSKEYIRVSARADRAADFYALKLDLAAVSAAQKEA